MNLIAMYRIRNRKVANDELMDAKSNFDAHYFHANDNDKKLLFTTLRLARKDVNSIILAVSENRQLIGKIRKKGKFKESFPDNLEDYQIPSQWKNRSKVERKENYAWYEIDDARELSPSERGQLVSSRHKDSFETTFNDTRTYKSPIYMEWLVDNDC